VTDFDLRALVDALRQHDVDFVVIGGVAVAAHGYVRATRDLDIVPDPHRDNVRRLAKTLRDVDATLPLAEGRPFELVRDLPRLEKRENMTFDTALGGLDVIQQAPGVPSFTTLAAGAVGADVLGVPVRISSLDHLRAMKAATGRAQDRADLENLPESSS
jgi:hypothetical protein